MYVCTCIYVYIPLSKTGVNLASCCVDHTPSSRRTRPRTSLSEGV